jgi:hypothetical protein
MCVFCGTHSYPHIGQKQIKFSFSTYDVHLNFIFHCSPFGPIGESSAIFERCPDVLNRFHQKNRHVIISSLKQANIHILKSLFKR